MNLGKSIQIARAKHGLQVQELAEKLGMKPTSLSQLSSQKSCTGATLQKLAAAFDMKVSEFVALGED
jgi:transcriptional regulator with XRE-family HTH domain